MRYKCLTYLMRYDRMGTAPEIYKGMYINLSRWCNQPAQYSKKEPAGILYRTGRV